MLKKIPKGTLLLIGGAEDGSDITGLTRNKEYQRFEILNQLLPKRKGNRNARIEIITTASTIPTQINKIYKSTFKKIGFDDIGFINMSNNKEADKAKYVKRVKAAHAIFFTGGDQFRLATILGSSDVVNMVKEKYIKDKNFIVAGTSAGAMALTGIMLYEGENNEAMLSQTVKFSSGLGFLYGCIIDTHFIKRGRFGRLAQSVVMNPSCIGIGLGEDTALIIKHGNKAECKGSGMVIIIDGKDVGHTNIAYAAPDVPLCIENLRVHILSKGNGYALKERKFIPSKRDIKAERLTKKPPKINKRKSRTVPTK